MSDMISFAPVPSSLRWGNTNPHQRGAIIASSHPHSMYFRNAIGAYGGASMLYRALSVASGSLSSHHRPDLSLTQPSITFGPFPAWSDPEKIVTFDPWGHLVSDIFTDEIARGLDVRPTIAITTAQLRMPEIHALIESGELNIDGRIIASDFAAHVTKIAIDPVWYLPEVARRLSVDEAQLRENLHEHTGGMYPELISRPELKVFLPPIGGMSVYLFGDIKLLGQNHTKTTVRIHDECNGSDVFSSDICTCRPYLIYGIAECIRMAQEGGIGVMIYMRKEGRALGEVTKFLVYNARQRQEGGDQAATYFTRTACIAGVEDARFQNLMPDVLHWLGITRIDRLISMSSMKYDALCSAGIHVVTRVPLPEAMIPPEAQVEISAKKAAGYYSDPTG
jgi:GTP cyclohydrolase II